MNNAALNSGAQISVGIPALNSFQRIVYTILVYIYIQYIYTIYIYIYISYIYVYISRNGIAGSKGNSNFFEELPHFFIAAAPFNIPISNAQEFQFLTFLSGYFIIQYLV